MPVKMTIHITKEILNKSANCDSLDMCVGSNCAFALAVKDLFPFAHVGGMAMHKEYAIYPFYFERRAGIYKSLQVIRISQEMYKFIARFDAMRDYERKELPEQDFEIEIPDEVISYLDIQDVYKILEESKTLDIISIKELQNA